MEQEFDGWTALVTGAHRNTGREPAVKSGERGTNAGVGGRPGGGRA